MYDVTRKRTDDVYHVRRKAKKETGDEERWILTRREWLVAKKRGPVKQTAAAVTSRS